MQVQSFIKKFCFLFLLFAFSGEAFATVVVSKSDWRAYRKLSPVFPSKLSEKKLYAYVAYSMKRLSRQENRHLDKLRPKRGR